MNGSSCPKYVALAKVVDEKVGTYFPFKTRLTPGSLDSKNSAILKIL